MRAVPPWAPLPLLMFSIAATAPAAFDAVQTLELRHGVGAPPALTIYLDLADARGEPPASLPLESIRATIGGRDAAVRAVTPFASTGAGVAYIFLVDVSQSLSPRDMTRVREALSLWAGAMTPHDRVALIAFGDDVAIPLDFTADRAALARAAASLAPRARTTKLYTAIERAIALSRRRDPGLPDRRVAIVLSDGQDEGSGLTADDVAARLREDGLPIYAIGYSRGRGEARRRGFDSLLRLARNSGGLFRDASSGEALPAIYQAMQRAVTRVFALQLHCEMCPADGALHRLEVTVKTPSRVLADGIDLRLAAPDSAPANASPGAPGASAASGAGRNAPPRSGEPSAEDARGRMAAREREREEQREEQQREERQRLTLIAAGIAAVVGAGVLAIVFVLMRRRKRRNARDAAVEASRAARGDGVAATGSDADADADAAAASDASGANNRRARRARADRVMVACHFRGRHAPPSVTLTLTLHHRLTIGADPACDLRIAGDADVAAVHGELTWEDGRVRLRRVDAEHATLVNGAAVDPSITYPLENGDLLLIGRTELRVLFDEAPAPEAAEVAS